MVNSKGYYLNELRKKYDQPPYDWKEIVNGWIPTTITCKGVLSNGCEYKLIAQYPRKGIFAIAIEYVNGDYEFCYITIELFKKFDIKTLKDILKSRSENKIKKES